MIAAAAAVGLAGSYAVAARSPVPRWELDLTTWINDAPDWVSTALWPVMQLGSIWGPIVVGAGILAFRKDRMLATATVLTGAVTWVAAKGVKSLVERGRPLAYLPHIAVRDGRGTGLGYISGHAAVAAATAIMAMAALPRRARPAAAALAGVVGVARVVAGVHLPADVVGGWSFGALMGLAGLTLLERARRARAA